MRIGIIGGGFSGTMLAIQLIKQSKTSISVYLINPNDSFGKGVAYSTNKPYHLLNVPACKMSAFADQPNHFVDWLQQQDLSHWPLKQDSLSECFAPRQLYGQYIHALFQQAKHQNNHSKALIPIVDTATEVTINEHNCTIHFAQNTPIQCDKVVMATGNPPPHYFLPDSKKTLSSNKCYFHNPWQCDFNKIQQHDSVFIVGTGLTAVDVLLTLHEHKHTGPIILLSRHGLLPQSHTSIQAPIPPLALEARNTARKAMCALRQQITQAKDWRQVIDAQRPMTQNIWQTWSLEDKQRFLRHVRSYWDIHRHRIAPTIFETIQGMFKNPQCQLIAGRIQSITQQSQGFTVSYRLRHSNQINSVNTQWIINCTGPNTRIDSNNNSLTQSLVKQGAIQSDLVKLGLLAKDDGRLIGQDQSISNQLFTIGPPLKSTLWEIIAVPDIRNQVKILADTLLEKSKKEIHV